MNELADLATVGLYNSPTRRQAAKPVEQVGLPPFNGFNEIERRVHFAEGGFLFRILTRNGPLQR